MPKLKVKEFHDDIYSADYIVCLGTKKDANSWALKRFNILMIDKEDVAGRFSVIHNRQTNRQCFVIWVTVPDAELILHEVVHAAIYLFENRGIRILADNDEPFAYYIGWLFHKVQGVLKK